MTGFYISISRDGGPKNVEIEDLTDQELTQLSTQWSRDVARTWTIALVRWIRENVVFHPPEEPKPGEPKDRRTTPDKTEAPRLPPREDHAD